MSEKVTTPEQEEKLKKDAERFQGPPIPEIDISDANEALEKCIMELVFNEPFYANLMLNMRREFTSKIPTAGVNVTDEVNLFINPYFFKSLTLTEQVGLMKHECHHVINNHFARFRDLEPQIFEENKERDMVQRYNDMTNASVLNMAADYAINEYIPELPKEITCFDEHGVAAKQPDKLEDGSPNPDAGKPMKARLLYVNDLQKQIPHVQGQQHMEYYYDFLQQEKDKNQQQMQQVMQGGKPQKGDGKGQQFTTLDDHSIWHESDADEDAITEKVKEVVNKAVEQTGDRNMGNLPADIQQAIDSLNYVGKDWRGDLQRFVARSMEILIQPTRKKRNRRFGVIYPGIKKNPKLKIAVAIDTSGSVNDEELNQFFAEIERIHNLEVAITVIECDTQVGNVYDFDPKKPFGVKGRGGTRFKPVFDHIEENNLDIDGLIYLTDGGCWGESDLKQPRYPVMWALLKGYELNDITWGSRTYVEVKKKVSR